MPTKTKQTEQAKDRHKFFMKSPFWIAFGECCKLKKASKSGVLTRGALAYIRKNAALMRKHGKKIPDGVFTK